MTERRNLFEKSLNLFSLDRVDRDIYSWTGKNVGWGRVFGGQVMAQTLIAAYKTIDVEHYAHSFHSYFLRPGDMFVIQRILEVEGKLTLLDQNKVIEPHPSFRLFATTNTVGLGDVTGLYHGTQQINQGPD